MNQAFDLSFLMSALRRRWLLITVPTVVGTLLAVTVAFLLPPTYRANALILVESQQIPTDLARSTVAVSAAERIRAIQQRLTTRENLLELSRRHRIMGGRTDLSPTETIERIRSAISIQSVGTTRRSARADTMLTTISISFTAAEPAVAAQVTNDLLSQVIQQNVQERSARAGETLNFFNSEAERLATALAAVEARITAFSSSNDLALPGTLEARRTELANLQNDVFTRESRRLVLNESKRALEEALTLGQSTTPRSQRSPEEVELERLRANLSQQRAIYADTHPSVRALNAQIAALQTRLSAAPATEAASAAAPAPPAPPQLVTTLREIERLTAELSLLDEQRERDAARMRDLEASIARAPEVAAQMRALGREQEALQSQYREVLSKQAEAATGARLEANQQAERFEVIEQPQVPDRPISPNRVRIAGFGGILSLMAGLGLAAVAELLNQSIRTSRDIERLLDTRPIAVLPVIRTAQEIRRQTWLVRVGLILPTLAVPLLLYAIDQYHTPLSVLGEQLMRQSGIEEVVRQLRLRFGF